MSDSTTSRPEPALSGLQKIYWAERHMPVLNRLREELEKSQPFKDRRIGICLHLEAKTAFLALVLKAGGAEVAICGSNPLTTQDDVAAGLASLGVKVFARRGASAEEYRHYLHRVLDICPHLLIDDGGDLVSAVHGERRELIGHIIGGAEETTTGVRRLRAMEREGVLGFPMVAVNNACCKYLFDNRYGTGQSTWDGIMRATNLSIAGKRVVVAGFGWCGKGIAQRARGLGARVIVTEVDPIRANEALMEGYEVMPMAEAALLGDIFITATGCAGVIGEKHFKSMKDGALLANAGHFDVEVDVAALRRLAREVRRVREGVEEFLLEGGKRLYLLAEGRLVNIAAADGHPVEIMDLSFALQTLSLEYLLQQEGKLKPGLYPVPLEVDCRVAQLRLEALGVRIDELTQEQKEYLSSWQIT
ncbi:MAG TPA: adenosylhomocysteinase [Moorella mulderi]|nr:adenosylhomocysteinase [Moorella mulderi]